MGRHALQAVHCLMAAKIQEIHQAVLESISINVPQLRPSAIISDREPAASDAFKMTAAGFITAIEVGINHKNLDLYKVFGDNPEIMHI